MMEYAVFRSRAAELEQLHSRYVQVRSSLEAMGVDLGDPEYHRTAPDDELQAKKLRFARYFDEAKILEGILLNDHNELIDIARKARKAVARRIRAGG